MFGLIFLWKVGIFLFENRQCQNITEKNQTNNFVRLLALFCLKLKKKKVICDLKTHSGIDKELCHFEFISETNVSSIQNTFHQNFSLGYINNALGPKQTIKLCCSSENLIFSSCLY